LTLIQYASAELPARPVAQRSEHCVDETGAAQADGGGTQDSEPVLAVALEN